METLYTEIESAIKANVPEIRWIDTDEQQFELYGQDAPIDYPCVLIGFPEATYENTGRLTQIANITVTVRVAFRIYERSHATVPEVFKNVAMKHLNIVQNIMEVLHGLQGENRNMLIRTSFHRNQNPDPKVYTITFSCAALDSEVGYVNNSDFKI